MNSVLTELHQPDDFSSQSQIRLELPGEVKSLEDLHLKLSPLPKTRRRRTLGRQRSLSHDAGVRKASELTLSHRRKPSLTPAEAFFLHGLLIDEPQDNVTPNKGSKTGKVKTLSDSILFSIPPSLSEKAASDHPVNSKVPVKSMVPPKPKRPSIKGLWQAHFAGVHPNQLVQRRGSNLRQQSDDDGCSNVLATGNSNPISHSLTGPGARLSSSFGDLPPKIPAGKPFVTPAKSDAVALHVNPSDSQNDQGQGRYRRALSDTSGIKNALAEGSSFDYDDFCPSDDEVRPKKEQDSDCISWDDEEHLEHFNAWEILRDEYADDFGFETHSSPTSFQILGTSADDSAASPHVMSPPMMDALMKHLPPAIRGDNYWLRFSLVRDGANLETLKRYVRSSQYTVLAVETDQGQVFGSFTSSPWRNNFGFFGSAPAFVWKMRHGRQTPCASLFEQAELESQVDVYPYVGKSKLVQVCRHDLLAVGGDDNRDDDFAYLQAAVMRSTTASSPMGFAIALEEDLLRGTTSPCTTFRSPALCDEGSKSQVFYTSGLEVWTLTPCRDVDAAERMEMTKFFIEESSRSSMASTRSSSISPLGSPRTGTSAPSRSSKWGSQELIQEEFFRRVGHDPESEERRQRWQYHNMMDGGTSANRGMSATPRFGY